jgi:hypothetical protein
MERRCVKRPLSGTCLHGCLDLGPGAIAEAPPPGERLGDGRLAYRDQLGERRAGHGGLGEKRPDSVDARVSPVALIAGGLGTVIVQLAHGLRRDRQPGRVLHGLDRVLGDQAGLAVNPRRWLPAALIGPTGLGPPAHGRPAGRTLTPSPPNSISAASSGTWNPVCATREALRDHAWDCELGNPQVG